jgi:DNA polymerase I
VHLDLYKFFFNRSIQTYAFSHRYIDMTLSGISEPIIGIGKVRFEVPTFLASMIAMYG